MFHLLLIPAANRAKTYGIIDAGFTTGFEPGNWWLPSSPELFRLIRNVTWGTSGVVAGGEDIVNRALTLIGGTRVSAATNMWSSSEFSISNAWYYGGTRHLEQLPQLLIELEVSPLFKNYFKLYNYGRNKRIERADIRTSILSIQ